jgi:hypothetical protein
MEFLASSKPNIFNHGNEPIFVVCNRKEVIDLTLGTNEVENLASNWHVSDETSLSDHRYICFQISNITVNQVTIRNPKRIHTHSISNITANQVTFRNPRRINRESYKDDLKVNLETISRSIRKTRDTDRSADQLQQTIILSYYHNCSA